MVLTIHLLAFLIAPVAVLACEGECIIGITNEFLNLYSSPISNALQNMASLSNLSPYLPNIHNGDVHQADQIDAKIVPPSGRRQDAISYFTPVLTAYNKTAYTELRDAIFPGYFHGKCQNANGVDPPGCPNPDCAKVCGTPGSLVHFYDTLEMIVFNQTRGLLTDLTSPGSKTYKQVQAMVLADASKGERRALSKVPRSAKLPTRGTTKARKNLQDIMKNFPAMMMNVCGGDDLSQCSWETDMKRFILQYP
ncbi:hypothetical protein PAXRUDRAFT_664190 [Paxillus rubicundulus Ve08.2h10]|uniref:Uncharacterized protein n=1 Tax=Paxillus rubicundulus Ve08.2h10 TaxID=930991 RepID=A0A0D0E373_9AGAM|nr:hypothetical protein PAXRUDRAFT_664190 [Paxillus rubicundulus Ve08.2h10]